MIYHSHTATEAYPSRTDISLRAEPDAHYVLVSTREPDDDRVPVVPDRGRRGHRGSRSTVDRRTSCSPRGRRPRRAAASQHVARPDHEEARTAMAIEVRIPTILRTYTGGEKAVEGRATRSPTLIDDLDSRHPGLRGRLITDDGALHRFVNVYVNDEDVRFLGGAGHRGHRRRQRDHPAGGRRAAERCAGAVRLPARRPSGDTPLVGLPRLSPVARTCGCGPSSRTATRPARSRTGRRWRWSSGRGGRAGCAPGCTILEPTSGNTGISLAMVGQAQGLPAGLRDAGEHLGRAPAAAADVRRGDHLLAGRGRLQRGRRDRQGSSPRSTRTG